MRVGSRVLLLVFVTFACGVAHAQEGPPLTSAHVKQFIAALPEIEALSRELGEGDGALVKPDMAAASGSIPTSPLATAAAGLERHAEAARFRAVVKKHGFSDLTAWGQAGDRIVKAYASLMMESEQTDMPAEMKEAMEEIDKSEMTADQKKAMKEMMQASQQMMGGFLGAPQADKDVVKGHLKELEAAFEKRAETTAPATP